MTQAGKKLQSILMAVIAVFAVTLAISALTAQPAYAMDGNGSSDNPYQIKTYEDLKEFANIVNGGQTSAYAKLTADITWPSNEVWVPISNYDNQYTGHFNGDNKVIKNLSNKETGAESNYQGLF